MALLLKDGSVFLHIPKTGGTWVRRVLKKMNLVDKEIGYFHSCSTGKFVFTFVRNPFSWYESWFKYQESNGWKNFENWHPCSILNGLGSNNFETFLKNVLSHHPGFISNLFFSYTSNASFVGKQENLRENLCKALSLSNINFDKYLIMNEPPLRVSQFRETIWSKDLRNEIKISEFLSITMFDYF
jgi:hypothetical protein